MVSFGKTYCFRLYSDAISLPRQSLTVIAIDIYYRDNEKV